MKLTGGEGDQFSRINYEVNSKESRGLMFHAIIALSRSVHMGATQVPKRGEGEEPRFFLSPTPLPLSVLMHSKPSVWQNYAYFVHTRNIVAESSDDRTHRTLLYICMHVPTRNVPSLFFFLFPITFSPHILTPSYTLLDHVSLLLPLTMLLQMRMADSQLMFY